jgi:hypothetical protein
VKKKKLTCVTMTLYDQLMFKLILECYNASFIAGLAMLADSEVRNKLFELVKLLAAAGVFSAKDGANLPAAFSNIMGFLMPQSSKDKKNDHLGETKQTSVPKYDFTYDATTKEKDAKSNTAQEWTDKIKKIFK